MRKCIKKILTFILALGFLLNLTSLAGIAVVKADMRKGMASQMGALAEKSGYSQTGVLETSIESIVANIIQYVLSFLGVIFIILIIYSGFMWMTAAGDSEKITKAKDILISAVIGIIIVLSAYVITTTILTRLGKAIGT